MFTKARWDKSFIFNSIRLRREWLPRTLSLASARELRRYLEAHGACDGALETLKEAVKVWNATYGAADERQRRAGQPTYYKGADAQEEAG
jgi:hypothetical protein